MKAYFIVPQITHYRISFYEKLIKANSKYEWLIIDGEKKIDDGRPTLYKRFSFPTKRFPETTKFVGPFTFKDYPGLYDFVRSENPDLVIMPTIPGSKAYQRIADWGHKNGKAIVLWSCLWEQEAVSKSLLRYVKRITFKRFIKRASHHIAYSSYAQRKLIRNGIGADLIQIAHNGLDIDGVDKLALSEYSIKKYKEDLGITSENRTLLYVGGLGKDKLVDLLLKSFSVFDKKHPDNNLKLVIIGDGPEKTYLQVLSKDLNINSKVLFLGRIVENVDHYFQLCDAYVLPGCGGLGLNQAMYWQKPCIVSHADGTEEDLIIDGKTGFRFDRSSLEDLEKAISRFYETDNITLQTMGVEAKNIILKSSNVNAMLGVFKSVIDKC